MKKLLFIILLGALVFLGCEPIDPPPDPPHQIQLVNVSFYVIGAGVDNCYATLFFDVANPFADTGYIYIHLSRIDVGIVEKDTLYLTYGSQNHEWSSPRLAYDVNNGSKFFATIGDLRGNILFTSDTINYTPWM